MTGRRPRWLGHGRARRRDDRPLLVRARDEPDLFGSFFEERHEQVLRWFARRVLDPETAFDLTAETFASAFESLGDFRGTTENEANAWMWTIARNRLLRWRERGVVEKRSMQRLGIDLPPMSAVEYERAEELADLDVLRPRINACLEALKPEHRQAVQWRVIDERGYSEIAADLGVSEVVVRARVSRGLRQLATLMAAQADVAIEEAM